MSDQNTVETLGVCNERNIFGHLVSDVQEIEIPANGRFWVAVVLTKSGLTDTVLAKFASKCIEQGARYFACSGGSEKRAESVFDHVIDQEYEPESPLDVILTTEDTNWIECLWDGIYMGHSENVTQTSEVHVFTFEKGPLLDNAKEVILKFNSNILPEEITEE